MKPACEEPLALTELLSYERGELPAQAAARVEAHYFECPSCTRRLETLSQVAHGVKEVMRAGQVSASVTRALLERAAAGGIALRSYRLAPGATVACTAAPSDDFVVVRLVLPGIETWAVDRIDLLAEVFDLSSGQRSTHETQAVDHDLATGEVIYAWSGDRVRAQPRAQWRMQARLRGPAGERLIGPFTLDHTPWEQLPANER